MSGEELSPEAQAILAQLRAVATELRTTHSRVLNLAEVVTSQGARILSLEGKVRNLEVALMSVASQAARADRRKT